MLLASVLTLLVGPAAVSPPSVQVRWDTTPGCVDEDKFREQLLAMVGAAPDGAVTLGAASAEDGAWTVSVSFGDMQRELHGHDCGLLTEAVALIVAIRIDPIGTAAAIDAVAVQRPVATASDDPSESTEPHRPVRADRVTAPPADVLPSPAKRRRIDKPTANGGAHVGADFGSLPRGGVAFGAEVAARWRMARLELGAFSVLGPATRETPEGARAVFRVFSGVVRGCGVIAAQRWEAPLCGGVEVGVLQARPTGLPNDVNALWLAPTAGVRLQRWFPTIAPAFFLDLAVPVLQHQFSSAQAGTLHTLPALVLRAGLALRIRGRQSRGS